MNKLVSNNNYNPKVSEVMTEREISELFDDYGTEEAVIQKYMPLIMNFKLNPDFIGFNMMERDYKRFFDDLKKMSSKKKMNYLITVQVEWLVEMFNKNPYEAYDALKNNRNGAKGTNAASIKREILKIMNDIFTLSKQPIHPYFLTISDIDALFRKYGVKKDMVKKYKPLIKDYKMNPHYYPTAIINTTYEDTMYKRVMSMRDKSSIHYYLILEQAEWIIKALGRGDYAEADDALQYVMAGKNYKDNLKNKKEAEKAAAAAAKAAAEAAKAERAAAAAAAAEAERAAKAAEEAAAEAAAAAAAAAAKAASEAEKKAAAEAAEAAASAAASAKAASAAASPASVKAAAAAQPETGKPMKRCPRGTRRNPKTKVCEPTKKAAAAPQAQPSPSKPAQKSPSPIAAPSAQKKKRCPNGTRRNPKTGVCEPKK